MLDYILNCNKQCVLNNFCWFLSHCEVLVVLGSPFLGKILLTFVVVPVHVETCEVMVGSNVLIFQAGTSVTPTPLSQLSSCLQQVWALQQGSLQPMQQLQDPPLQRVKHNSSHKIPGFSEEHVGRSCHRNLRLNWELCNGISWKKAMQWCPTKYNLPMVVSFIIPGPPWHKNTGHEHLLDARWDLSTNDLFQEYFTLSGYCHSLVLQVISQGGREKARDNC